MASGGYGYAESYVMQKLYKEKLKKIAQAENLQEEKKIHTLKTGSTDKTSTGCFSLFPKKQHKKSSHVSDSNDS
ncbi:unnamed protein product [Lathyrus sativus]|nr:unnamed protein product [Lathyrus sativus]